MSAIIHNLGALMIFVIAICNVIRSSIVVAKVAHDGIDFYKSDPNLVAGIISIILSMLTMLSSWVFVKKLGTIESTASERTTTLVEPNSIVDLEDRYNSKWHRQFEHEANQGMYLRRQYEVNIQTQRLHKRNIFIEWWAIFMFAVSTTVCVQNVIIMQWYPLLNIGWLALAIWCYSLFWLGIFVVYYPHYQTQCKKILSLLCAFFISLILVATVTFSFWVSMEYVVFSALH